MASSSLLIKEKTMIFRQWTRLFLLVPLLLSAIQLTPAQALTTNSVMWCPSAVTAPKSNQNGCSPLFPTMALLLSHLDTKDPAVAVTIWMGNAYNSAEAGDGNIVLDGTTFVRMLKYPLTIKGGWNGPGKSTIDLNTPSTLDAPSTLAVVNWKGKVTLKNIQVFLRASSTAGGCTGGATAAVCVQTKGGIQLDRVSEENPTNLTIYVGAILDNSASVSSPPGSVVVTNSSFLKNNGLGLYVLTKGAVSLKGVTANENGLHGAVIANTVDATASPVIVTNGQFNQNSSDGLAISSNGTVTLTNIYVEGNAGIGMGVDNTAGSGSVILKGTNSFLGNGGIGATIHSNGSVTAQHLVAYQNADTGVRIDNSTAPTAKGVTITGSGDFTDNAHGLGVYSRGNVSLNRGNAYSNTTYGIYVRADGNVTLTCSGTYGNNIGLYVHSLGGLGPVPKLTLQGFLNYGNTTPEDILATSRFDTACPTP
jgi:hypothetical protein